MLVPNALSMFERASQSAQLCYCIIMLQYLVCVKFNTVMNLENQAECWSSYSPINDWVIAQHQVIHDEW